jgi:hypothetical protein
MSDTFKFLREYLGDANKLFVHLTSLAYRPQGHGTEPTNKKIVNRLRDLVNDPAFDLPWDDEITLALIEIIINFNRNSETNAIPICVDTGDPETFFSIPATFAFAESKSAEYSKMILERYTAIREILAKNHTYMEQKRTRSNNILKNQKLLPGQLVLHNDHKLDNKLDLPRKGPFKVVFHRDDSNFVDVKSLLTDHTFTLYSGNLSIFHGSEEEALEAAKLDDKRFLIAQVLGYKGDIYKVSTITLLVEYVSGSIEWIPVTPTLFDLDVMWEFIEKYKELKQLSLSANLRKQLFKGLLSRPITIQQGTTCYVNLRSWGENWYAELDLPNCYTTIYMVQGVYGKSCIVKKIPLIDIDFPVLEENYNGKFGVNGEFIYLWGSNFNWQSGYILVDEQFLYKHPQIIAEGIREAKMKKLRAIFE